MSELTFNRAEIDLGTLEKNYRRIAEYASGTPIISVVKADAYGHGAKRCSQLFYDCGCRFYAVANAAEALAIKECVGNSDIMILGITSFDSIPIMCENRVISALASYEQAKIMKQYIPLGARLRVHIKLDTGMNRIGFSCDEKGLDEIRKSLALGCFEAEGLFSHFACADMPGVGDEFTDMQYERYNRMRKGLEDIGFSVPIHHIANSAATFLRSDVHLDMVRCGIILYGINPSDEAVAEGLEPVMTLKTKVVHIHELKEGDCVGYGATYKADKPTKIATLPIGYDDGFIRAYSTVPGVLVNGQLAPIVGRICMDQCMIDISNINAKLGDDVELFGKKNRVELFAKAADTIPYESLCIVSKRVPRVYIS